MKFPELEIENFQAITYAKISLADRGLVLIQGVNHDDTSQTSNGTGKSSLPDAMCWCLYGTTAQGASGDEIINTNVGKGTRVATKVEDGADTHLIIRHRKHPKGKDKLHAFTNGVDMTKGTDSLTQAYVTQILGSSHDVFKASIYAGQENLPDLPGMTDKPLKILIEEASGVTLLENAYKTANKEATVAYDARDAIDRSLVAAETRREWIDNELDNTTTAAADWQTRQEQRINDATAAISERVRQVKALDVEIAKTDAAALETAIIACDAKIGSVAGENVKLRQLESNLTLTKITANQISSDLARIKGDHERQKTEIANIAHKLNCPCDECGRSITDAEIGPARDAATKRLAAIVSVFGDQKKELEKAAKETQAATTARDDFQATMSDVSAVSAERASLQSLLTAHSTLVNQRKGTADLARAVGEQAKQLRAEPNPHLAAIKNLNEDLQKTDATILEIKTRSAAAQTECEIADCVAKVYAPAGVRAHILDDVTPFLNQATSEYLTTLSDGNIEATWTTLVRNAKGELREKFAIEVSKARGAPNFKTLSGGEKRKVRLATALALQDLVATRATKPIELFIADEIDDALDDAGLERLTQILVEKANKRGSVFVISHNQLRDWIPNILQVEKKNDQTIITEFTA